MSVVTNLIIAASTSEDAEYILGQFKKFQVNGNPFFIASVDNENLPKGWYGGSKYLECHILIGAYNHLVLQELMDFMRKEIKWEMPECVQVFVKEQDDMKFRLIDLFISTEKQ